MPLTDRDKRTLTIGGIIVGVLVVIFLALKLLGGGGGTETASFSPRPTTSVPGGTSGGTTTTPTLPTTSTTTTSTPGGGTRTPSQPSGATETIGGHQVTLIDTFTTNGVEQATVSVDGTVYRPSAGETFGPNKQYKLQSVSGNCATFLFGDQSFTLCVPQNK